MSPEKIRNIQYKKLLAFFKVELILIAAVVSGGAIGCAVEKRAQERAERDAFEKDSVAKVSQYDYAIDSLKNELRTTAVALDNAYQLVTRRAENQKFKSTKEKCMVLEALVREYEASYAKMSDPIVNQIEDLEMERQTAMDSLARVSAKIRGKSK